MYLFRSQVGIGLKRLDIVYCLNPVLTNFVQGLVKSVVRALLINILHVQISVLCVGKAIMRIAKELSFGFFGI